MEIRYRSDLHIQCPSTLPELQTYVSHNQDAYNVKKSERNMYVKLLVILVFDTIISSNRNLRCYFSFTPYSKCYKTLEYASLKCSASLKSYHWLNQKPARKSWEIVIDKFAIIFLYANGRNIGKLENRVFSFSVDCFIRYQIRRKKKWQCKELWRIGRKHVNYGRVKFGRIAYKLVRLFMGNIFTQS